MIHKSELGGKVLLDPRISKLEQRIHDRRLERQRVPFADLRLHEMVPFRESRFVESLHNAVQYHSFSHRAIVEVDCVEHECSPVVGVAELAVQERHDLIEVATDDVFDPEFCGRTTSDEYQKSYSTHFKLILKSYYHHLIESS